MGQHFLKEESVAERIADTLTGKGYNKVLEIGPGTGVLTRFLLQKPFELLAIEIDRESVPYLKSHFPELKEKLIEGDFLQFPLNEFTDDQIAVIGNFPYHISSQILFRMLDFKELIPELSGMFQKELAERVASPPGSKSYGVISVLVQAYYDVEYLFTVPPGVFSPPPKVNSGVIRLIRRENAELNCNTKLFKTVVKQSFNQRRKTIRNSLKSLLPKNSEHEFLSQRPEQLSVDQFVELTNFVESGNQNQVH